MDNFSLSLRKQVLILALGILFVLLAYHFIDRPIVFWAKAHNTHQYVILKWFTHISDVFIAIAVLAYPILAIRFHYQKQTYHDHAILAFANSIAITSFLNFNLKYIFGRYWADTWIQNNPSLLRDGLYGFNWFHGNATLGSFPSGHTAITVTAMTVIWLTYPRLRWLAGLLVLLMVVGQVSLHYHFLSDAIAGATLGYLVASSIHKRCNHLMEKRSI
jgi:membrane-associated phospholipid phosphatase